MSMKLHDVVGREEKDFLSAVTFFWPEGAFAMTYDVGIEAAPPSFGPALAENKEPTLTIMSRDHPAMRNMPYPMDAATTAVFALGWFRAVSGTAKINSTLLASLSVPSASPQPIGGDGSYVRCWRLWSRNESGLLFCVQPTWLYLSK